MSNIKTVYTEYANKCFQIPKALFFGKYEGLSMKARFQLAYFKEISKVSDSGTLYLDFQDIKEYEDVIQELEKHKLIQISNDRIYFVEIQIDNKIVKRIQELEQGKKINIKDNKQLQQEQLIEQAFYGNDELPERLINTIQVFSESTDEAQMFFEIIMKAKKKVESEADSIIWLEHDSELLEVIVNSFSRSVRKINREKILNKNGYIYKAIYTNLSQKLQQRNYNNAPPLFNWLDGNN